jgi:DnaJ-class molecular chaperone
MNDIFEQFFSSFGGSSETGRSSSRGSSRRSSIGQDLESAMRISFMVAVKGQQKN